MEIFRYSFYNHDKFTILKFILRKLLRINLAETKKKFNLNLALFNHDYISNDIIVDGVYEYKYLITIIKWLEFKKIPKKLFVDVGANIGNHSVFMSKFFKKVVSFEPHKKLFELLLFNTKNLQNIKIFNYGLSNKNRKARLYTINSNMGGSTLLKIKKKDNSHLVKLIKFDHLNYKKKINLIKIDAEGHETNILKGMVKYLKKNSPIIIFECDSQYIKKGSSPSIRFLKKLNYKFYSIENYSTQDPNFIDKFLFMFKYFLNKNKYIVPISKLKKKYYPLIIAEKS